MSGRRGSRQGVELNLASMLDMAFQLLTFFILTFRPPPLEGQISLRLPPARAVGIAGGTAPAGQRPGTGIIISPCDTLAVTVFSQDGKIDSMDVGQRQVKDLAELDGRLTAVFKDVDNPFQQVLVRSSPKLHYGELMRVVEVCGHQNVRRREEIGEAELRRTPRRRR